MNIQFFCDGIRGDYSQRSFFQKEIPLMDRQLLRYRARFVKEGFDYSFLSNAILGCKNF
jgi:hypothetical protein